MEACRPDHGAIADAHDGIRDGCAPVTRAQRELDEAARLIGIVRYQEPHPQVQFPAAR